MSEAHFLYLRVLLYYFPDTSQRFPCIPTASLLPIVTSVYPCIPTASLLPIVTSVYSCIPTASLLPYPGLSSCRVGYTEVTMGSMWSLATVLGQFPGPTSQASMGSPAWAHQHGPTSQASMGGQHGPASQASMGPHPRPEWS